MGIFRNNHEDDAMAEYLASRENSDTTNIESNRLEHDRMFGDNKDNESIKKVGNLTLKSIDLLKALTYIIILISIIKAIMSLFD